MARGGGSTRWWVPNGRWHLGAGIASLVTCALTSSAQAQTPGDADPDRATVQAVLGLRIPTHVAVRVLKAPAVVALTPEGVELELAVETTANVRWRLSVTVDAGEAEVWTAAGQWEPACPEMGAPVVVLAGPTNAQVTVVRLRVRGAAGALRAARGRVVVEPVANPLAAPARADAPQGAVSVSWRGSE